MNVQNLRNIEKFKIFASILFEKRRVAQGIRRLKAADSPLLSASHFWLGI